MGNFINDYFQFYYHKENIKENNIITIKNVKKKFKSYNILDTNKNIIIGIWDNPDKSNILGNQGIWIGNNDKIYELIFGINCNNTVILYFKNSIVLKISNANGLVTLELKNNKDNLMEYSTNITRDIIKKLNKINNNSPDLDLIFNVIK
jgi:hypothetical protein